MSQPSQFTDVETLILGAGPAGLQLGYFLERAGRDYLILEAAKGAGDFFRRFPRHRQLISNNKVFTGYDDPEVNLRFDWNSLLSDDPALLFKNYSLEFFPHADVMVRYLEDFAVRFALRIRYGARAKRVSKNGRFEVETEAGERFSGARLVVATGLSRAFVPPIPGIELADNYVDVSVDRDEFRNQRVLIVGKGNSGFETADHLVSRAAILHIASPRPVQFAWRTHHVGHLRAVNNNVLDTYQLKSQNAVLDCAIEWIARREDGTFEVKVRYTHAHEEQEALLYDRVIVCTGFRFDDSIFDETCRPRLAIENRFPEQTSAWESSNIPGLYVAGGLMQMRDFKKITSGFIHGFRYNCRALHRILEERYHGNPWPETSFSATPEGLADAMLARLNRTSALWQMFGYLAEVFLLPEEGEEGRLLEEIPLDYVRDGALGRTHHFAVTLEFGKSQGDTFNVVRRPDPRQAQESFFLHPVIRHFRGGEKVSEHHVLEHLFGEWREEDLHRKPLLAYLERELSDEGTGAEEVPLAAGHGSR